MLMEGSAFFNVQKMPVYFIVNGNTVKDVGYQNAIDPIEIQQPFHTLGLPIRKKINLRFSTRICWKVINYLDCYTE